MKKLLYVARFEFVRHIKRRGFIWAVIGLPAIMTLVVGGIILFVTAGSEDPIGVVDNTGLMANPDSYTAIYDDDITVITYDDEDIARRALADETIQAYFVVPADYLETGVVNVYHEGSPNEDIYGSFNRYARTSLLSDLSTGIS